MYKHILAPIDGSAASQRGLQEAIGVARDQQAQLRLLSVVDDSLAAIERSAFHGYDELVDALRVAGQAVLAEGRQQALAQGLQAAQVETIQRETTAHRVAGSIVAEAKKAGCDLIVMGTHGRRGVSHLVLGSDAELVIKTSPVPVLLVRPPD
jgi:nucleotide-binding universal stress UspA family protein